MIYYTSTNIDSSIQNVDSVKLLSVEEVLQRIKDAKILALDTETTSLNYLNGKIIMLQLGTEEDQYIIDIRNVDIVKFRNVLEDSERVFVGHNIKFDYNFLKNYDIILSNVWDTMIVDQVIHNGKYGIEEIRKTHRFSLKGVYQYYFHKTIGKEIRQDFTTIKDRAYNINHILYGAGDVIYPLQIKKKQEELIAVFQLQSCIRLENKVVLALGDIEYNGLYLDRSKWMDIILDYKKRLVQTEADLDELLLQHPLGYKFKKQGKQLSLFGEEFVDKRNTIVNWSSDQQVLSILQNIYNLKPKDKDGKDSSGADAIKFLDTEQPITNKLLKYREETKVLTSFGEKYLKTYIQKDNKIHTSYNQIVRTGRMSSSKPNCQQIKKDGGFRDAFIAPNNKLMITADYSSQEARVMADMAEDPNYIDFFKHGNGDIHSFVSTRMFSVSFGKEFIVTDTNENKAYRHKGKTLNFAISFGASAYTIAKRLKITETEAQKLIDIFFQGFPALDKFFKNCREFGLKKGYIKTNNITNRIRWFPEHKKLLELQDKKYLTREEYSEIKKLQGSIGRESQNTIIQGSAADITKTALILLRKKLLENDIRIGNNAPVKIVLIQHDEILLEVNFDIVDKWVQILKECMESAAKVYCNYLEIPANPCIATNWQH